MMSCRINGSGPDGAGSHSSRDNTYALAQPRGMQSVARLPLGIAWLRTPISPLLRSLPRSRQDRLHVSVVCRRVVGQMQLVSNLTFAGAA